MDIYLRSPKMKEMVESRREYEASRIKALGILTRDKPTSGKKDVTKANKIIELRTKYPNMPLHRITLLTNSSDSHVRKTLLEIGLKPGLIDNKTANDIEIGKRIVSYRKKHMTYTMKEIADELQYPFNTVRRHLRINHLSIATKDTGSTNKHKNIKSGRNA